MMVLRMFLALSLLATSLFSQNPNASSFPTTIAVDQNLLAAKRLSESSLNGSINASTTTVVVSDGTQFLNWQIVRIDSEEMLIQSVSSNTLTIVSGGRGYNGTTAASHTTGAAVRGIITSWHHNQLAAEVKAIETRLRNVTGQCQDAGVNDTYACSPAPPFTAYATGMIVNFKAATANSGPATVSFNSIGNTAIKKVAGGVTTALDDNDIRAGQWVTVVYDGTNFQMISALGNSGSSGSGISSCVPTSASGTAYTCTPSPSVGSYTTGLTIAFKPDVNSSGSATLNVNGLGVATLLYYSRSGSSSIGSNTLLAGAEYLATYDGTNFIVIGIPTSFNAIESISDEASLLTFRAYLNFTGAGVTCADDSGNGRTNCTIPADAVKAGSNTWSGANDFSGATSFIARFGTTAAASGDCDASGERGNVYVQTGDPASVATRVSVCTQTGASTYAWMPASHKVGTTAPATCAVGEIFFDSDATAGSNWFGCTASNTWTVQGGGGSGVPNPSANGIPVCTGTNCSTSTVRTITAGAGISVTNGDGVAGNPTVATDTAVHPTATSMQNGVPFYCVTSTSTTAFACAMTPTANSSILTSGAQIRIKMHASNTGSGPTITIDSFGPKPIYKRNGTSASAAIATGELLINQTYVLTYTTSVASGAWETDIGGGGSSGVPATGANGIVVCTGTNCSTSTTRTITASGGIAITNGDGVSGAPAIASTVNTTGYYAPFGYGPISGLISPVANRVYVYMHRATESFTFSKIAGANSGVASKGMACGVYDSSKNIIVQGRLDNGNGWFSGGTSGTQISVSSTTLTQGTLYYISCAFEDTGMSAVHQGESWAEKIDPSPHKNGYAAETATGSNTTYALPSSFTTITHEANTNDAPIYIILLP